MTPRQHRQFHLARRRQQVSELYLQGWSQAAIGTELNVSQSTINEDIQAIQKQWRASSVRDFDAARELELRKLNRLEREAWAAWERSQKPTQAAVVSGEGPGQRTRKTMKNQVGDAKFLDLVHKCIAQRKTLLGLDAPIQIADVTPIPTETLEQRRAKLRLMLESVAVNVSHPRLPAPDQETSDESATTHE